MEIKYLKLRPSEYRKALDVTWKALPDYTCGENALVVVDGSGSMCGYGNPMPAAVALSLGIYFAEIEAVFRLILTAAKIHQVPQEEMPSRIYIVSDMELGI